MLLKKKKRGALRVASRHLFNWHHAYAGNTTTNVVVAVSFDTPLQLVTYKNSESLLKTPLSLIKKNAAPMRSALDFRVFYARSSGTSRRRVLIICSLLHAAAVCSGLESKSQLLTKSTYEPRVAWKGLGRGNS